MNDLVTVRNKITRGVARVPRRIAEHPKFGEVLEIVPDGTKPFVELRKLSDSIQPKPKPIAVKKDLKEDDK